MKNIESKTLTELENNDWGETDSDSYIEQACFRLRKKKIGELDIEDLRILIGQGVGVPFLLPIALTILESNPLAEGRHYKGDLLCSVLQLGPEFHSKNKKIKPMLLNIISRAKREAEQLEDYEAEITMEALTEAVNYFETPLN